MCPVSSCRRHRDTPGPQTTLVSSFSSSLLDFIEPLIINIVVLYQFYFRLKWISQDFLKDCKLYWNYLTKNTDPVWFIGVHVRRTDYDQHLRKMKNSQMVKKDFFARAMKRMELKLREDFKEVPEVNQFFFQCFTGLIFQIS